MTLTVQFYTLITMIGMGSYFGAALDTYIRFLNRSVRKGWIVFINDFLFWVIQGLIIFYVLFLVNEGEFRLYLFLALLCGFAAYQALLKNIYKKLLESFIVIVIKSVQLLTNLVKNIIFLPIKWIIVSVLSVTYWIFRLFYKLAVRIGLLILAVLGILLKPFIWMISPIWDKMPNTVKKTVGKFYHKGKGFFSNLKKLMSSWFSLKNKKG